MKPLTHGDSATRQGLWHGFSLFALLAGGVLAHGASFPVPATGSALAGPTAAEWDHKWNLFKKIGKSDAEIQDKLDRTYAQWLGRTWKGKDPGAEAQRYLQPMPGRPEYLYHVTLGSFRNMPCHGRVLIEHLRRLRPLSLHHLPAGMLRTLPDVPANGTMKEHLYSAILCLLTWPLFAAEPGDRAALACWPQWRGPLASGVAPEADPPLTWSETHNVRWKVKIPGAGTATPILWEDKLFILTAVPTGRKLDPAEAAKRKAALATLPGGGTREVSPNVNSPGDFFRFMVLCLDRETGKTLWEKVACEEAPHEGHHRDHGYASASPVTDGKHLVVSFGSRGLYCYDLTGGLLWKKDLGRLFTRKSFGEGSSPALHGNTVVVVRDHEEEDFLMAFDKKDGRELWRAPRTEPTSWTTPLIVEHAGQTQVIVASSSGLRAHDIRDGRELWSGPPLTESVIPSPVTANGVVYAMSDYQKKVLYAVRLGKRGVLAGTDAILWNYSRYAPYVSSPLAVGDLLYFGSNTSGRLTCLNARTGEPHFEAERIPGLQNLYASPVAAKNRVYVLSREGTCVVLKQGPKLEILATNALEEKTDASMILAGKGVFIRGQAHLYRIAED